MPFAIDQQTPPETSTRDKTLASDPVLLAFVEKVENLSLFQDRIEKPALLPQVWQAFREEIDHQIASTAIGLFLVDRDTHCFDLTEWTPTEAKTICQREINAQIECGTFAWIVNRRQPAVIPSLVFSGPQTLVMLPLTTHARTLGVAMIVTTIEENAVTHERLRLLGILSKQCALVMENTLLYDQLKEEHVALRTAQAQIIQAEKFAAFGRLTSGAFHELLNPLNIISGHLQIMMMANDLKDPLPDYLALMKTASDRIDSIVNSLLQFSKQKHRDGRAIDVNAILRQIATEVSGHRAKPETTLTHACQEQLPEVMGNEDDLKTVLRNLLENAYDAIAEGGAIHIRSSYPAQEPDKSEDSPCVEIMVADTGVGIRPSDTHKVFDPFFTTKDIGEGMGLSLAISYALVCSMGGTISFKSGPQKGTTFSVKLPVL